MKIICESCSSEISRPEPSLASSGHRCQCQCGRSSVFRYPDVNGEISSISTTNNSTRIVIEVGDTKEYREALSAWRYKEVFIRVLEGVTIDPKSVVKDNSIIQCTKCSYKFTPKVNCYRYSCECGETKWNYSPNSDTLMMLKGPWEVCGELAPGEEEKVRSSAYRGHSEDDDDWSGYAGWYGRGSQSTYQTYHSKAKSCTAGVP